MLPVTLSLTQGDNRIKSNGCFAHPGFPPLKPLGSTGTVKFSATIATTTTWGPTQIVALVPSLQPGVAQITVIVGGTTSNSAPFTVTTGPYISGLSLTTGPPGMGFVISGAGFGTSGQATLNRASMTVVPGTWSNSNITVQVPSNAGAGGPVVVTVSGSQSNNNYQFAVTDPFGCQ